MTAKFHISKDGEAKPCKAEIKGCPLGESMPHFNNKEAAQQHFENIMKPLPKKTEKEEKFLNRLKGDNIDTAIAINESSLDINIGGKNLEYFDQVSEPEYSQGNSKEIADFVSSFTEGEDEYDDGLIEVKTINYNPIGKEIKEHSANIFTAKNPVTNKDEEYVVDFSYSEVNPNADYPYVDTLENWKKSLDKISFTGVEEYIPPPPDPRAAELPKFKPGEHNPLIEKSRLSEREVTDSRYNLEKRFLKVGEVKVAAIHYKIEDDGLPHIYSLETRPEYKNQGYMKKLLKDMAKEYNVDKIYSSGKFTPHGYNYTSHLTKPRDGEEIGAIEHPDFTDDEPFTFVEDWVEGTIK